MIGWEISRIVYKGDGITKEFPYTYTVQEKAEMVVTLVHEDGTNEILAKDYFVDLDKKTVNYPGYAPGEEPAEAERPEILPTGAYLVLSRSIPITQETYLGDKWPWNVNEDELDKITMILQDLKEESDRHLTLSAEVEGVNVTLPSPKPNMGFYWDETGTKLVEGMNPKEATEQAAASAADAKASAEQAEECAASAKASEENAEEYAKRAKESAMEAEGQASAARSYLDETRTEAFNAQESATAAAASADLAKLYAEESRAVHFKGVINTYSELPKNPQVGEQWQILKADTSHNINAGDIVAWNGSQWVNMGGLADFSQYLTKSAANSTYLSKTSASATYAPKLSPTFSGTVTAPNLTVTNSLTIPGGKVWIA